MSEQVSELETKPSVNQYETLDVQRPHSSSIASLKLRLSNLCKKSCNINLPKKIQCANCQQAVPVQQIKLHSDTCKLPHYKNFDPVHTHNAPTTTRGYIIYLQSLLGTPAIHPTQEKILEELKSLLQRSMTDRLQQSLAGCERLLERTTDLSTRIFIERAVTILKGTPERTLKSPRITSLQRKLKAFQNPSKNQSVLNLDFRVLKSISSEVASKNSQSSVMFTHSSDEVPPPQDGELLDEVIEENTERAIYRIILQTKIQLNDNHPGQCVPPEPIYKEIIQLDLPKIEWKRFIESKLAKATQPLSNKAALQRPRRRTYVPIATIIEEMD